MNSEKLISLIEAAGFEAQSYSGRCMYGEQCVGVTVERETSQFKFAMQLALSVFSEEDDDDLAGAALEELSELRVSTDSMGFDTIVYFPGVALASRRRRR